MRRLERMCCLAVGSASPLAFDCRVALPRKREACLAVRATRVTRSFKHQRRIMFALLCLCLLQTRGDAFSCHVFRSRTRRERRSARSIINPAQDLMRAKLSPQAASTLAVNKPRRSTVVQLAYRLRLSILTKLGTLKSALLVLLIALTMFSSTPSAAAAAAVTRNQYRVAKARISTRQNRMSVRQRNAPAVKKASAFVILATFAASSYRASLRQKKVARTITPFGVINNVSVLGNGVSVIRVSMSVERSRDIVDWLKKMDSRHRETMSLILGMSANATERTRLRQIYQSEYISRGNTCSVL